MRLGWFTARVAAWAAMVGGGAAAGLGLVTTLIALSLPAVLHAPPAPVEQAFVLSTPSDDSSGSSDDPDDLTGFAIEPVLSVEASDLFLIVLGPAIVVLGLALPSHDKSG